MITRIGQEMHPKLFTQNYFGGKTLKTFLCSYFYFSVYFLLVYKQTIKFRLRGRYYTVAMDSN